MKRVKLVQLDGKLPNLALMKLAHWHRSQGDEVRLSTSAQPTLLDQEGTDIVYGSAIFRRSLPRVEILRALHPQAVLGGTGSGEKLSRTVEQALGLEEYSYEHYDYSIYPGYPWSLGFTQRGCRLNCGFCVVPGKEGKPQAVNTIGDIWRPGTERNVVLLDNDFFGQPREQWQERIREMREGNFRVNFSQGVNIRLVDEETAKALASVRYHDRRFTNRRLHTAWDNLGQERVFFRGVEKLEAAGVPARHLMVYMLVGFAPQETIEEILYRYRRLTERGCKVFPMVYQPWRGEEDWETADSEKDNPEADMKEREERERNAQLRKFQRWVIQRYSQFIPWEKFQEDRSRDRADTGRTSGGQIPPPPISWSPARRDPSQAGALNTPPAGYGGQVPQWR